MKNVLIIAGSPRKGGNSDILAEAFASGARDGGNLTEIVYLRDWHLGYCQGCYACEKTGKCFQKDGMNELCEKILAADVLAFATPVYFYNMSGQMKVFIDRLVPIYAKISSDIYLFCNAWDSDETHLTSTLEALRGATRDCFENCTEKGAVAVAGVNEKGSVNGRPELRTAYEMGKNC